MFIQCCLNVRNLYAGGTLADTNSPCGLCKATLNSNSWNPKAEYRSCEKVKVAILGSLFLTVLMVSVDVKQH